MQIKTYGKKSIFKRLLDVLKIKRGWGSCGLSVNKDWDLSSEEL